jgi:hypothetical protein
MINLHPWTDRSIGPCQTLGLHLYDVNVACDNLVSLVGSQSIAYQQVTVR